ncbi:MAG: acetyl-CoA carboxylase carboxyl transferase subunit alpha [Deltaproteobacteria bacterium]|nr:acetyl-CoA carboxylase carboxyl transferase subunit alpha [Deltaproteobacteria bacterium]
MKTKDHDKFADIDKALKRLEHSISKLPEIDVTEIADKVKTLRRQLYNGISRWESLELARLSDRPGANEFINIIFNDFMELYGDRIYGDDPAIIGGLATLEDIPLVVIAHQKHSAKKRDYIYHHYGMACPEGHYKAIRLMRLAEKFDKPIVTFVDTPGAYPGPEAEYKGQAFSIARCISTIASVRIPVIACIIGEAGSGGALALGFGDRVIMLEHAFYSAISPEGFSSIIWDDTSNKETAADILKGTGHDLYNSGLIDYLVKEPVGGAHNDPAMVMEDTKGAIKNFLKELSSMDRKDMLDARVKKIKGMMPRD